MGLVGRARYMQMKSTEAMMHAYCGDARLRRRKKPEPETVVVIRAVPSRINDMPPDGGDGFIEWDALARMKSTTC